MWKTDVHTSNWKLTDDVEMKKIFLLFKLVFINVKMKYFAVMQQRELSFVYSTK